MRGARPPMAARQFVYHMQGLSKTYPGNRKVLENVNLSFYPDAKIGVLGPNGSGKSTLLRIMAGVAKEIFREGLGGGGAQGGFPSPGTPPRSSQSGRGDVDEGGGPTRAQLERPNRIA